MTKMTAPRLLACGPYFAPGVLGVSVLIYFLLKPLAYYAFIQAFRYRVDRPSPMTNMQAIKLAALRAILGLAAVGLAALALFALDDNRLWELSWFYLYWERLFVWFLLGMYGAKLDGRRLVGWTIGGTAVNAAFDLAVVAGLAEKWIFTPIILGATGALILFIHKRGRRDALRGRFPTYPLCWKCQYNLTGNISGVCPECGTKIGSGAAEAT